MKKFIGSLILALVLSVSALAQYPTPPNTGKATTPYSTGVFSATFNGPVSLESLGRNDANTSSDFAYESDNAGVYQFAIVRTIDHAIAVDYTSSDFYVEQQKNCDTKTDLTRGNWEGHPYSYSFCTFTLEGQKYTLRTRFIIVNSTTVLILRQFATEENNDRDVWLDFEYSLRIR